MKNIMQSYLKYKKITIPVTIVVAVLIIGGVTFGVQSHEKENSSATICIS